MVKTVIFDLGGVLLDIDMGRCIKELEALGLDAKSWMTSKGERGAAGGTLCEGAAASKVMDQYQMGQISTKQFLGEALKGCRPGTTWQQVVDAWNAWLICIPIEKLEMLKRLRKEGYKVYMLSNTNEEHWRFMEENMFPEPVSSYFDEVFMSQLLGMAKPDLRVFEYVLRKIGEKAENCLYVDDTVINCEAAARLGLHICKVEPNTMWEEEKIRMHLD